MIMAFNTIRCMLIDIDTINKIQDQLLELEIIPEKWDYNDLIKKL